MTSQIGTFQIQVKGLVQGVGFRPFVYRLASRYNILGTVDNRADGVLIVANCTKSVLEELLHSIKNESPEASSVHEITFSEIEARDFHDFTIVKSKNDLNSKEVTEVSPDIAVCKDCLEDMKRQPHRIDYPLINCTHCGPRFTIVKALPYDRDYTTMRTFPMCDQCLAEYQNVLDRRFHAQPVACNECGPHYTLYEKSLKIRGTQKICQRISDLISDEMVLALKGMGGFHLICDALSEGAVSKLRQIKHRDAKPFAVMFRDLDTLKKYAEMDIVEEGAVSSWQHPIVLLKQKKNVAKGITNGFSKIGAILPYMPFHHLMFDHLQTDAIVLTSGNYSDEPIVIDNQEMQSKFENDLAAVVSYNRDIYNRTDDSVMQKVGEEMQIIRRSRSYAPQSIPMIYSVDNIVATGAELLNTFVVGRAKKAFMSQHIGDLKNPETFTFFEESLSRFKDLFRVDPRAIACDIHPDYLSSKYAQSTGIPVMEIQHHHAHLASCMAEHNIDEKVIGIIFDGTGLGSDGNIWGSEFLIGDLEGYERYTHFEYLPLPGGDQVTKEPWRTAVSALYKVFGDSFVDLDIPFIKQLDQSKTQFICQMIDKKLNSPLSSGMGRLFDAVSAILGLTFNSAFHAEAPMRLEDAITEGVEDFYAYGIKEDIKIGDIIKAIVADMQEDVSIGIIAARFHNTLVKISLSVCLQIRETENLNKVVLSGGSFQNKYLSERLILALKDDGFEVYSHQQVPSNDGGISLGQIAISSKRLSLENNQKEKV